MMPSTQTLVRNTLTIGFLTLCLSTSTALATSGPGTPEQVEPKAQQPPVTQVDPQRPQNPPTQQSVTPKPKPAPQVVETPLEDMWEGMLDFFYGSDSDSTRTK